MYLTIKFQLGSADIACVAVALWLNSWRMSRGPLWSLGGAIAALLAAGSGRQLALLAPTYPANPAADAAIHLASQLAESVARSGHDLAAAIGEDTATEACTCEPRPWARARLLVLDSHLWAFLAGALVWPFADVLRLLKLAWRRRVSHVEAALLAQVRPPARP
jgi:hypothetical protein